MTVTATARAASPRRPPQVTVVWAITLAWAVAVAAELTGRAQGLHHDRLAQSTSAWAALGLFLLAWQLMIAAMMLPTSLPLIRLFGRASANQPRPLPAKAAFLGGYAVVWSGFGAAAFLGDLGCIAWWTARPGWPPGRRCSAGQSWCWQERSSSPSSRTAA